MEKSVAKYTATKRKITTPNGERVVYIGKRGCAYVKLHGKFVAISKIP